MSVIVLAVVGGYLLGTVSFARIAARVALSGADISVTEYEVPGTDTKWVYRGVSATSVLERAGWKWGVGVIVLDALKAFAPTMALRLAFPDSNAYLVVAVAVIAGHVWPVWWRFVGGRGQSTLLGALLAIDVLSIPVSAIVGSIVGLVVFTSVYLARNMGPALLVPWFALAAGPTEVVFALSVNVIYWVASRGDVAEELAARRARGINDLPYPARLGQAWSDFFSED
ncbi:MAG: glycerol-3-phosphate acyltransferase [Acidimicrobiia bacterium]|nr:glycerol-3-phosphate acyltransferase [Acidimicrobiia bacterium]